MLDLFSGIGGFSLAAQWVWEDELEIVSFVEIDPFCQKVLKKHWPSIPIVEDIKTLDGKQWTETIDLVTGGFPCQPFSIAGKKHGRKDDRFLWPEMLRIIKESKPTWIVAENVANIFNLELDKMLFDLENEEYEVYPIMVPACSVGAMHLRNRVWILAHSEKCRQFCLSDEMENTKEGQSQKRWVWESSVKSLVANLGFYPNSLDWRTIDGFPDWMDRIKSLGNAIVPQVAYQIMKAIKEIETYEP